MAPNAQLVPSAGRWLKRWQQIQDAVSYVQQPSLGALMVQGDTWRVEVAGGGDVLITLFSAAHLEVQSGG